MSSECGIHLEGAGKPTEVQISQCWVFNTAHGIIATVLFWSQPMHHIPPKILTVCPL